MSCPAFPAPSSTSLPAPSAAPPTTLPPPHPYQTPPPATAGVSQAYLRSSSTRTSAQRPWPRKCSSGFRRRTVSVTPNMLRTTLSDRELRPEYDLTLPVTPRRQQQRRHARATEPPHSQQPPLRIPSAVLPLQVRLSELCGCAVALRVYGN